MMSKRGFTLAESLCVLMVFGVALGLATTLLSRYLKVGRYVEQRQEWQSIRAAVQRMCEEVYEAQTASLTGDVLTLRKFSPSTHQARRDKSLFTTLDPYDESYLVTIGYQLVDQELRRNVEGTTVSLAGPLDSLDMALEDGLLTVNVSFSSETAREQQTFLVEVLR